LPFTDDFNRADSATVGNGWIENLDSAWAILSDSLRRTVGDYLTSQIWRPTSENFASGVVSVEWKRSSTGQFPIICARKQSAANTFYMMWAFYNTLYISKVVNGTKTDLVSQSLSALGTVANTYKFIFTLSGTSLVARAEGVTSPGLIGEISTADSSITASGQCGLSGATGGTATIDYDNFSAAMTIDATKSVTDDGAGADSALASDSSGAKNIAESATADEGVGIGVLAPLAEAGSAGDSVAITVSAAVGDAGSAVETPSVVEPAMLALLERFDGTLSGWTLDTAGGTAQIQTVNNDEKLVLDDASAGAVVSAARTIEGQSAPFCVEADMWVAASAVGVLEALDSANNVLFSVKLDGATLLGSFATDSAAASTFVIQAGKYYNIVLYCDTLTDTVRAWYMTGSGTAPQTWTEIGAAKSYSGGLASKIRLRTDAAAVGEARFDEVKVYRPNVFCIGDSNTAGYAASSSYWNPSPDSSQRLGAGEDEAHSYPHWLGLKFTPPQWAANRGLNAAVSSNLDSRIQGDVIDQGAQTVVILIGTNDITANTALATIQTNIQSAANKAAIAGLTVCLCSVPPNNAWNSTQNTKRNDLNAWIQSHCAANNYRFADVYAAVKNPSNPDQLNPSYDSGDGLHFGTTGLQTIADTVYAALLETKALTETAYGADSVEVRNFISLLESALGLDNPALRNFISLADSGAAAESAGLFAVVGLFELAASMEGLVAGGALEPKSASDEGAGSDSVSAIIREGATLQDVYDLTMTRLSSSEYVRPDNEGIDSLLSHAIAMSKWKNNRLGRTGVSGRVETWVLYDDDGTTPLLTWTHDTAARTRSKAQ